MAADSGGTRGTVKTKSGFRTPKKSGAQKRASKYEQTLIRRPTTQADYDNFF